MSKRSEVLHVSGMHCASCEDLLEDTCKEIFGNVEVKADFSKGILVLEGEDLGSRSELVGALTERISERGYRVSEEKLTRPNAFREYVLALPPVLAIVFGFFMLQNMGLESIVSFSEMTYATSFLVGIVASVSTCLAVVGGLVLSLSAHVAKQQGALRSHVLFHLGRLGGFFVLGGFIGLLGGVVHVSAVATAGITLFAAFVMAVLGITLLDIFPGLQKMQIRIPKSMAKRATLLPGISKNLAPLLAGVATFFLPCGFTQSMQVYALTTGTYFSGGLTMLFFALGTFPVLAMLSFGVFELSQASWKGVFFKATGMLVLVFAGFNAWNAIRTLIFTYSSF